MATHAQTLANRQNARHSTGPVTADGKSRSAQNSWKHGLTARELIVRDDEREEFETLSAGLVAELRPSGALEEVIFNQLLHAAWNQHRLRRLEAELFHDNLDPLADPAHTATLDRYARYQVRMERAFTRALRELRTLQTERALRLTVSLKAEKIMPPLGSMAELAKRSQSPADQEFAHLTRQMRREQAYRETATCRDVPRQHYEAR